MMKTIQSKYQQKHYEVTIYNLDETTCPYCGGVFMVDFGKLPAVEVDGDYDFAKVICPYCGKTHKEHL